MPSFRDVHARWSRWEFWPSWLFNIPVLGIWFWFGLRSFNFLFFTRVNPAIETGGLFGESKIQILRLLPDHVYPKTVFLNAGNRHLETIFELVKSNQLQYPIMVKPDVGERGFLARKCADESILINHVSQWPQVDFLLQAYCNYPEEYSVFYYRFPESNEGLISSLCAKGFLTVTGDGCHTIRELMELETRSRFQIERLLTEEPELLAQIPEPGVKCLLEPIGNHCRGTTFLDACHRITPRLTEVFDQISLQTTGLFYGRFDLRCISLDALEEGRDFAILEYNGMSAEPAHIYHPGRSLWKAYSDIYHHWHIIYQISREQKKRGVPTESIYSIARQGYRWWKHKNKKGSIAE